MNVLNDAWFRVTLSSIGDAVIATDIQGKVIFLNTVAETLTGWTVEAAKGHPLSDVFHIVNEMSRRPVENPVAKVLAKGYVVGLANHTVLISKSGKEYPIEDSAAPIKDPKGTTLGVVLVFHDITERYRAEKELRQSEERFRLLVSEVKDYAIFMLDPQGRVSSWNMGAEHLKGYKAEEIIGQHFSRFYPIEERQDADRELEIAAQEGRFATEGWRLHKNGTRFWASVVITAIHNKEGKLIGFAKITKDLTEAKKAEEELKKSEQRFRLLVTYVKDYAIFMLDPQGYVATWNEGAERLKGYKANEIVGQHFSVFYPPQNKLKAMQGLETAIKQGHCKDEGWRVRKDGSLFWANVVITAIRDKEGKLIGFAKVTRDLTDRRKADEALRESEEKFRLLVTSVKDYAIFMLYPDGKIATWNLGAERLKGYKAEEIVGQHFTIFYLPAERDNANKILEIAVKEGRYEEEGWRLRKDGTRFWASVMITPFYGENHALIGFAKITQDLTQRKLAEETLRRSNEDLQQFAYVVSHDLQQHVRMIRSYTELARRELGEGANAKLTEYIDIAIRGATQMQQFINDLLTYSKLGSFEKTDEVVDLEELVQKVIGVFETTILEKEAVIKYERLPEVKIGSTEAFQLFSNLISNALKYQGSKPPRIHISVRSNDGQWIFSVHDNGAGIESKYFDQIFELFKRLHSDVPGTGIGLSICKKIVERYGGRIWVESEVGQGSSFHFSLPKE